MMKIVDVSKHNGSSIDWKKVKAAGIDGVIIRAGFGRLITQKDITFETNYSGAMAAGLHVGAYWYSYAESPSEAKLEAEIFLAAIKGKKFDLPVYFDIEEEKQVKLGKTLCTEMAETFCSTLENNGYFAGVYSFDSFFATNLAAHIPKRYSCWVARVDGKTPQSCSEYGMWQYSWKGSVSGISGAVDMNKCYKDFPTTIIGAGLNGYAKEDTYTMKAEASGVSAAKAKSMKSACESMGMKVSQVKE